LELCKQLAGNGHKVHLITRYQDKSIVKLAMENTCTEVHACDLEDLKSSIWLAKEIDDKVGGL
jgi:short-subunit dehydrogenase